MKYLNYSIITISCILFNLNLYSQTWEPVERKTPNNTTITADSLVAGEMSYAKKNSIKDAILNYWGDDSDFEYLDEATYKYNCHAYAWHVFDGGDEVWINTPNDDEYWWDGSYVKVSDSSTATVVSYGNCSKIDTVPWVVCYNDDCWIDIIRIDGDLCDHSAIIYNDSVFISKWAGMCLLKHDYDDTFFLIQDDGLLYFKPCREVLSGIITDDYTKDDGCELILQDIDISSSNANVIFKTKNYDEYATIDEYILIEGTFSIAIGSTLEINCD